MSIKSRYSITQPVNSNFYTSINVSGSTLIGTKVNSALEQGFIFVPCIMAETVTIYDQEYILEEKKKMRQKKLDSL